jgi:O-acetyl-ADP-ribose deacetylase (regulator of RNase III)
VAYALRLAAERLLKTIAFPAMGTGVAGFPMQGCATIMLEEAARHLHGETSVEKIYFVLFDAAATEVFAQNRLQAESIK